MERAIHPIIMEHIETLEKYFKIQREMVDLMKVENQPTNEFEMNSHYVRLREIEMESELVSERLSESIVELSKI